MKLKLINRKVFTFTIFFGILIFLMDSCSIQRKASKTETGKTSVRVDDHKVVQEEEEVYDEIPTPVGGDNKVRTVFQRILGRAYTDLAGSRVIFEIEIDKRGRVKSSVVTYGKNLYYNQLLADAMRRHIRFIPARKDRKKVKACFSYYFLF